MIEYTITLYVDSDEDALGDSMMDQLIAFARDLGFLGENQVELDTNCSKCGRLWQDHYKPEWLRFKNGPNGTFGLKDGDHTPHIPGHAARKDST